MDRSDRAQEEETLTPTALNNRLKKQIFAYAKMVVKADLSYIQLMRSMNHYTIYTNLSEIDRSSLVRRLNARLASHYH